MVMWSILLNSSMLVLCGRYNKLVSQSGRFSDEIFGFDETLFKYCIQISIQAFNDEDPQGRRTIGNLTQLNNEVTSH